jgi:hypothetical protein
MKIRTAFALKGDTVGDPGHITKMPPSVMVFPVAWPEPSITQIGIVSSFGHLHVRENYDPALSRVSMVLTRVTDDEPIADFSLTHESPEAKTVNYCLVGFLEQRPQSASGSGGRVQHYATVKQAEGLKVTLKFLGRNPFFETTRFNASFKLQFTYVTLHGDGRVLGDEPTHIEQIELLRVTGNNAMILALTETGQIRMANLDMSTGAIVWQDVSTT